MRARFVSFIMHHWVDGLLTFVLLVMGIKFAAPLDRWLDLQSSDEAEYLWLGRTLQFSNISHLKPEWSPLYLVWYRVVNEIVPDPVKAYYFNWRFLGIMLPIMLYILLRQQNVPPSIALVSSWFFLVSEADWINANRVNAFGVLLLSVSWWLVQREKQKLIRIWMLAFLLLGFVSFGRPEFFIAGLFVISFAILMSAQSYRSLKLVIKSKRVRISLVSALFLWLLWGPAWSPERTMYAFGQHYAYNLRECMRQPSRGQTWEDEVYADFGDAPTVIEAFFVNPRAFIQHIKCNIRRAPYAFVRAMLRTALPPRASVVALFVVLVITGWGFYISFAKRDLLRKHCRQWWTADKGALWILIWIPLVAALILIYSRWNHYLQMSIFWLYLPLAVCLSPVLKRENIVKSSHLKTVLLALFLFLLTPTIAGFFRPRRYPPPLYNQATVLALAQAPWREDLTQIYLSGSRSVAHYAFLYYLKDARFVELPPAPEEGFLDYIRAQRPDAIVVHLPRFHGDASWQAFAADPAAFGYRAQYILDEQRVLYLREAALTR